MYPLDRVIIRGQKMRPPRYYDAKIKDIDPSMFENLKFDRYETALLRADDNTDDRLKIREKVQNISLQRLKRHLS